MKILKFDYAPILRNQYELLFTVEAADTEISNIVENLPKKTHLLEVKPEKVARSTNSNSYLWILADKIANVILSTKEEVYRDAIREVGEWTDVLVESDKADYYMEAWGKHGIGFFAERFTGGEYVTVRSYYGSHIYDSVSMSRLLNYIVEQAKELGIETLTPKELDELKQKWGK